MTAGAVVAADVVFAVEPWTDCYEDARPLLELHWQEIAKHKDLMWLNADIDAYKRNEASQRLVIVTARSQGRLVGYVVWVLYRHPHYKHVLCAQEDIHFLLPEFRRGLTGYSMIKRAIELLRPLKVQYVVMREKIGNEHPALMKRLGFEALDVVYSRRLET